MPAEEEVALTHRLGSSRYCPVFILFLQHETRTQTLITSSTFYGSVDKVSQVTVSVDKVSEWLEFLRRTLSITLICSYSKLTLQSTRWQSQSLPLTHSCSVRFQDCPAPRLPLPSFHELVLRHKSTDTASRYRTNNLKKWVIKTLYLTLQIVISQSTYNMRHLCLLSQAKQW